ncbi:MAG: hypothetical protein IKR53_05510, partial [Clostridia bacterium]|nr:hypothetical protein [Clostridia bacterium]
DLCVNKNDAAAIRIYEKVRFRDTGYVDEDAPDCLNLMYRFGDEGEAFTDRLITDFGDPTFREAFRKYFREMGVRVENWEGLLREMNDGGAEDFYLARGYEKAPGIQAKNKDDVFVKQL